MTWSVFGFENYLEWVLVDKLTGIIGLHIIGTNLFIGNKLAYWLKLRSMSPANIKVIFIGAVCFVLWGGYNIAKSSYTAFTWTKTEGTVVDFERNVWSCGKGIGECYTLIVGYQVGGNSFTANSNTKFNHIEPTYLLKQKFDVYYSSGNPANAILGGSYGPMRHGIWLFIIGCVVLFIFWLKRKRAQ